MQIYFVNVLAPSFGSPSLFRSRILKSLLPCRDRDVVLSELFHWLISYLSRCDWFIICRQMRHTVTVCHLFSSLLLMYSIFLPTNTIANTKKGMVEDIQFLISRQILELIFEFFLPEKAFKKPSVSLLLLTYPIF